MRDEYVKDILQRTGLHPQADAFASRLDHRFAEWWGPGSSINTDAFTCNWGGQLLWMNPPYTQLYQVVEKISAEGAHCILVVPKWPQRKWYQAAQRIAAESFEYPANIKLFQHPHKRNRPSLWPVTVLFSVGIRSVAQGTI